MIAAAIGKASRDQLVSLGYTVEWQSYPMEHSVCLEEVVDISRWLQARLESKS
jgi:phospholipase/carboxylesterase